MNSMTQSISIRAVCFTKAVIICPYQIREDSMNLNVKWKYLNNSNKTKLQNPFIEDNKTINQIVYFILKGQNIF